jgi:ABC-2 type transport system ATP-binding protein
VLDGSLAEIKAGAGRRHVALAFHRDAARAARVLGDRTLVAKADDYGASAEIELADGADHDELLRSLVASGVGLSRFEIVEPSLQSIFIDRVGRDAATAPAKEDAHA